jgi:acetyl esterase/lipase
MSSTFLPRRGFMRGALAGGAALLGGCSPLALVNAFVSSETYRRVSGLSYGDRTRHALDVYQPAQKSGAAPVVVFFYGGNWNAGERGSYLFAGEALASKGFVTVIPDYRLFPDVRFPDFLADCARAVRWTFEHAARYGGDPQRVFLMGHSAGAYNAAMLALDPQYLRAAGVEPRRIHGLIGLAGPYDFLPLQNPISKGVFGFPDTPVTTQPIYFASRDDPPALLITATDDEVVDPRNSARLAARLRSHGVAAREIVYPGLSHTRLVGALAAPLRGTAPVLDDVAAFVGARAASVSA